jgi:hypothetical protein
VGLLGGILGGVSGIAQKGVSLVAGDFYNTPAEKREARRAEKAARKDKASGLDAASDAEKRRGDYARQQGLHGNLISKIGLAPGAAQRDVAEEGALAMGRQSLLGGTAGLAGLRGVGVRGHGALASAGADAAAGVLAAERGKAGAETGVYGSVLQSLQNLQASGTMTKEKVRQLGAMAQGNPAAEKLVAKWEASAGATVKKSSLSGDIGGVVDYLTT